jgi:ABC-type phosphate/phosphonate transport system permease subunit
VELGREFRLRISIFNSSEVLLLIVYVPLVFLVDSLSGLLRRMAR